MKLVGLLLCSMFAVACATDTTNVTCTSDLCSCALEEPCNHVCEPGGDPCHVQCAPGESCEVTCDAAEECHVEASQTTTATIDCGDSPECHVTCPATGCTVSNCVGATCVVSCGLTGTVATHNGTSVTCP